MRHITVILLLAIILVLSSCSQGNKFASSFGKRKYTKGYFVNAPGSIHNPVASQSVEISAPASKKEAISITEGEQRNESLIIPVTSHSLWRSPEKTVVLTGKCNAHPQSAGLTKMPIVNGDEPKDNSVKKSSSDVNYVAIIGLALSIAGVTIAAIDGFLPILATVFIIVGAVLCIYSLFLNKIYWNWLAIVGLSIIILFLVLLLL